MADAPRNDRNDDADATETTLHSAIALAYREGERAPKVVAKGRGLIAEEIMRRANEAGVYVHQSRDLVGLLMQVDLDHRIPPQLYRVIAELLAWLYRAQQAGVPPSTMPPAKGV